MIKYDYTNALSETIGSDNGIGAEDISHLREEIQQADEWLTGLRESGEVGFFELPYNEKLIGEIKHFAGAMRGEFESFVHIGIGGSALGPICLQQALNHPYYNELSLEERHSANHVSRWFWLY